MATYKKILKGGYKVQVDSAIRDGEGKKISTIYAKKTEIAGKQDALTEQQLLAVNSGVTATKVTNYDAHITSTSNPHSVTKAQVGLGNVDNTADVDKPISSAVQSALDLKLDKANANKNVMKEITPSVTDDNFIITVSYENLSTNTESSATKTLALASDTTAGLMSKADYAQIRDNKARIEQLEGANIRLTYTASSSPTAAEIRQFVIDSGYTDQSKWIYIAVVVKDTHHIWKYYTNTSAWQDDGVDVVNQFTNAIAGIIKGSATAGKVYAETDGTGSVYGWDDLNTSVSNKEDVANKTSTISAESTATQYPNAQATYNALNAKQNVIDATHKLSADLVADGTTNKVVTATEKDGWNAKSTVTVSATGSSTNVLPAYMTINSSEYLTTDFTSTEVEITEED